MANDRQSAGEVPKGKARSLANLKGGSRKGKPNKTTAAVKDMILQALANKGGVKYLEKQAENNPTAFLTLVGKVLPLDVNANVNGNIGMPPITLGRQ